MTTVPPPILFDLDGTLLDTLPLVFHCFGEALEPALGRRPTEAEIQARFGAADHEIVADWAGPEHASDAVDRLYAAYEANLDRMHPFPGVEALLGRLRLRGHPLGLFTGRGRPSADRLLRHTGLGPLFQATVTGDEVPHSKPAPDGLLRLLDLLEVPAETALYVGDSLLDHHSALAAGVGFVACLWGSREVGELTALDAPRMTSLVELERFLSGPIPP